MKEQVYEVIGSIFHGEQLIGSNVILGDGKWYGPWFWGSLRVVETDKPLYKQGKRTHDKVRLKKVKVIKDED